MSDAPPKPGACVVCEMTDGLRTFELGLAWVCASGRCQATFAVAATPLARRIAMEYARHLLGGLEEGLQRMRLDGAVSDRKFAEAAARSDRRLAKLEAELRRLRGNGQ